MGKFLKYTFIACIPIVLAIIGLFCMPLDREFAYSYIKGDCSGHGKWLHDRMFINPTPIDVAFLGSSATWNAVDDRALTEMLSDHSKKPVNVVNLGYCRLGATLNVLFVEELISHRKPKHIVIEVLPRPPLASHPIYGHLAPSTLLINPPTMLYQGYPSDLLAGLTTRLDQVRDCLIPDTTYVEDQTLFGFGNNPTLADMVEMEKTKSGWLEKDPLRAPSMQENISLHLYWECLDHLAKLCQERNVCLSFLFINSYGRPVDFPVFKDRLAQLAPLWLPPDSILQKPSNYFDPGHLNRDGAAELTPYLFNQLSQFEY